MNLSLRVIKPLLFVLTSLILTFGIVAAADSRHDDHGTPAASPMASPQASPAATPAVAGSTIVELKTGDMKFAPKELTIPANTDVTLRITNKGMLPHDVSIAGTRYASPKIASGESVDLVLNLAPGTYQFICTVPGHKQAGMVGTIVVK